MRQTQRQENGMCSARTLTTRSPVSAARRVSAMRDLRLEAHRVLIKTPSVQRHAVNSNEALHHFVFTTPMQLETLTLLTHITGLPAQCFSIICLMDLCGVKYPVHWNERRDKRSMCFVSFVSPQFIDVNGVHLLNTNLLSN